MIQDIIKTLRQYEHLCIGETIEIAKGKNEYITTFKEAKIKIRRLWHLKK